MAKKKLTRRQVERIKQSQQERRDKLALQATSDSTDAELGDSQQGEVITRHGQQVLISNIQGHITPCLIRRNIGQPVCGDQVIWQSSNEQQGVVTAIQPRSSVLARPDYSGREKPLAANITQLLIVIAPEPKPQAYMLDQYLVTAETLGLKACIAMNKMDIAEDTEAFHAQFSHYENLGYTLLTVSATERIGIDNLSQQVKNETSILVGQSGVGKSSLINTLLPDMDLQIGKLSSASGLGCHTTTTTSSYQLTHGGRIIDSPGVRSFRLNQLSYEYLEQGFKEFRPYLNHCKYSNCHHQHEPHCAIKEAVTKGNVHPQRLVNYLHLANNITRNSRK